MIPLLQTKSTDTAHMGIFASVTWPFSHFWVGPGDGANSICDEEVEWNRDVCTWEDYSKYREALQYSEAVCVGFGLHTITLYMSPFQIMQAKWISISLHHHN